MSLKVNPGGPQSGWRVAWLRRNGDMVVEYFPIERHAKWNYAVLENIVGGGVRYGELRSPGGALIAQFGDAALGALAIAAAEAEAGL